MKGSKFVPAKAAYQFRNGSGDDFEMEEDNNHMSYMYIFHK